ncbi:MAG: hypothetical protein LUG27_11650 [Clostridiales bacterium]|nr:hypothetical protein [Clostridiales bacterium]
MADKELRKMNRTELIEIIYALQQNEKTLRTENERLRTQLEDKRIQIENSGSIAEASLRLNHIFEDAELAARQYLDSAQHANEDAEQVLADARSEADRILADAQNRARQTETECQAMKENAEKEAKWKRDAFVRDVMRVLGKYPELAANIQDFLKTGSSNLSPN